MSPYRKLLVLVPAGHADCSALAQGIALARRSGAELVVHAFAADSRTAAPGAPPGDAAWLQATLDGLCRQGLRASGRELRGGSVQQAMLADILDVQPDLVIKELRRESALRRLFFTPEDWHLARLSPRPLLVVGQGSPELPTRLLAAVDVLESGTEPSLNACIVQQAARFAATVEAELHLAHVCEPVVDLPEDASVQIVGAARGLMEEAQALRRQRFAEFAEAHGVPEARRHVVYGRIDYALEDLSQRLGAQLVVAGSNYRSGLERFLLGSTTEDLLAHAKQNVLVIKPAGFEQGLREHETLQQG